VLERFARVQHLVSRVECDLASGRDALDALAASFPAGTVSGAPKVRAMQLVAELEPETRGPYAGAFGYLDTAGNLDTALVIRSFVARDGVLSVQAGAGVVWDSDPAREREETLHKARALFRGGAAGGFRRVSRNGGRAVILLLDNYDSFTFNLYQAMAVLGAEVEVHRNDALTVEQVLARAPTAIVLSPGPGKPPDAGIQPELLRRLPIDPAPRRVPRHQGLVERCGGVLERDPAPTHGKASLVHHDGDALFRGLPNPFPAGRYHSLRAKRDRLPRSCA
jgi:anthranilate synthase